MDLFKDIISLLENYDREKKSEGFVPTVEMLIEELKSKL